MTSPNGNYIFYLQPSGNLVLKQYHRTLWLSKTAFVEPFDPLYHVAFSCYDELILRDKFKHIMWRTINFDYISIYKKNDTESNYTYENLSKSNIMED